MRSSFHFFWCYNMMETWWKFLLEWLLLLLIGASIEQMMTPQLILLFLIARKHIFPNNALSECIILHVWVKVFQMTMSKGVLNQGIDILTSIECREYSIFNTWAVSEICFGEHSWISHVLTEVYNHIIEFRTIYWSSYHRDSLFISQFIFTINTRIILWLESSCEEFQFREDVDNDILDSWIVLN